MKMNNLKKIYEMLDVIPPWNSRNNISLSWQIPAGEVIYEFLNDNWFLCLHHMKDKPITEDEAIIILRSVFPLWRFTVERQEND